MLKKIGYISALRSQLTSQLSLRLSSIGLLSKLSLSGGKCDLCGVKSFHSCGILCRDPPRPSKNWVTEGEETAKVAMPSSRLAGRLPDENLFTTVFNGIVYDEIPIVNIKVSPNNTIINLTDSKGIPKLIRSCGVEGFKNVKKGTNIAAQVTAITFSRKALDMGYKTVRVRIQGLGPGRMSSLKGLVMGGLDIVTVTDNTRITDNPTRAKKLRRI